jgi:uncharacterized repeat protein (TIGR03803 family)
MMTTIRSRRRPLNSIRFVHCLCALLCAIPAVYSAAAQTAPGWTFAELYAFNRFNDITDGGWPEAGLVRDSTGNLYGTTFFGGTGTGCDIIVGANGCGTVFKVDPSGAETVLHSFNGLHDGANPTASLILDDVGNLYGTTQFGGQYGYGTVFKIEATGNETILHSFRGERDGANPNAGLTQDASGNFYGTTRYGGCGCDARGCGTVFKISASGEETVLYRFMDGADGASPLGSVALDSSGNLNGTTWLGGIYNYGTVFRISANGKKKVLHHFAAGNDGANPIGGVIRDQSRNIYGAASAAGASHLGALFMVSPAGKESILYAFTGGSDGAYPYSNLILDASGNLYGTAAQGGCCGLGTVYEFSAGTLIPLYGFSAAPNGTNSDGQIPMAGVTADAAGNLYGTASQAGPNAWGSVFELQRVTTSSADGETTDKAIVKSSTRFSAAAESIATSSNVAATDTTEKVEPICYPTLTAPIEVATPRQRHEAGLKAQPPLTDGFGWPDSQITALKIDGGYMFFGIDEGFHKRRLWHGEWVGNNNYGSVVRTIGTLDNPLGSAPPVDVVIDHNPDPKVNPHNCDPTKNTHAYCYTYIGGGPVYVVPQGQVGAGNWLLVYHAEYNNPAYFMLGLAISSDKGLHWTDIGEIIRFNMPFSYSGPPAPGAIGDPPLVISPDGKYFYIYFMDWLKSTGTNTTLSVARAPITAVLEAAFGGSKHYAAPFRKYFEGSWDQPGLGGISTDLIPEGYYGGGINVAYDSYIQRYLVFNSDSQNFSYAESPDGLHWTDTIFLGMLGYVPDVAGYAMPIGLGNDPTVLGKDFYVYYTQFRGPWPAAQSVKRFTFSCAARQN